MLIFNKIKLIYLANPKTGTTSFEHAFRSHADLKESRLLPKHIPFRRYKKKFPQIVREYEVIACVRDPLDTLYSWYRYRSRPTLRGHPNSSAGRSFEEFFDEWCKPDPAPYADVGASVGFVLNERGQVAKALTLFRYEDRMALSSFVAERLDLQSVPSANRNVSKKTDPGTSLPLRNRVDISRPKFARVREIYETIRFKV